MGPGRSRRDRQFVGTGAEQRRAEMLTLRGGSRELGGSSPQVLPFPPRRGDHSGAFTDFYKGFHFGGTKLLWGVSALRRMPGSGFLG